MQVQSKKAGLFQHLSAGAYVICHAENWGLAIFTRTSNTARLPMTTHVCRSKVVVVVVKRMDENSFKNCSCILGIDTKIKTIKFKTEKLVKLLTKQMSAWSK